MDKTAWSAWADKLLDVIDKQQANAKLPTGAAWEKSGGLRALRQAVVCEVDPAWFTPAYDTGWLSPRGLAVLPTLGMMAQYPDSNEIHAVLAQKIPMTWPLAIAAQLPSNTLAYASWVTALYYLARNGKGASPSVDNWQAWSRQLKDAATGISLVKARLNVCTEYILLVLQKNYQPEEKILDISRLELQALSAHFPLSELYYGCSRYQTTEELRELLPQLRNPQTWAWAGVSLLEKSADQYQWATMLIQDEIDVPTCLAPEHLAQAHRLRARVLAYQANSLFHPTYGTAKYAQEMAVYDAQSKQTPSLRALTPQEHAALILTDSMVDFWNLVDMAPQRTVDKSSLGQAIAFDGF